MTAGQEDKLNGTFASQDTQIKGPCASLRCSKLCEADQLLTVCIREADGDQIGGQRCTAVKAKCRMGAVAEIHVVENRGDIVADSGACLTTAREGVTAGIICL